MRFLAGLKSGKPQAIRRRRDKSLSLSVRSNDTPGKVEGLLSGAEQRPFTQSPPLSTTFGPSSEGRAILEMPREFYHRRANAGFAISSAHESLGFPELLE